jgi:hypothetical protein
MDDAPKSAWQPFTPQGVAAFAHARLRRLLIVQGIMALFVALAVTWQLDTGWFPPIQTAIDNLPDSGEIRRQKLAWPTNSPTVLADGRFLALSVDLDHTGEVRSTAQLQAEFGRDSVFASSQLGYGYAEWRYPPDWVIAFNRKELKPLWGAWKPFLLAGSFVGAGVGVVASWWVLALIYCLPVRLAAFFTNRNLTALGSWKLAGAALIPGAALMLASIMLYGFGSMDLVQLLFVTGAHVVLGWIYLFLSLLFVPSITASVKRQKNPFTNPSGKV